MSSNNKKRKAPPAVIEYKQVSKGTMAMIVVGMLGSLACFVLLFTVAFTLFDLMYYLPALAVSAVLIFVGLRRAKGK